MLIDDATETFVEQGGGVDTTSVASVSFSPISTSSLTVSESVVRLHGLSALSLFFFKVPISLSSNSPSSDLPTNEFG